MSDPILQPLRDLRSALRRLAVTRGIALSLAVFLGLCLLAGTLDWLWHIDSPPARLGLVAGICTTVAFVFWQLVIQPAWHRLSELQVAQRVEQACPEFDGRLSSSVDFVQDAAVGSAELEQKVVALAADRLHHAHVRRLIDKRPAIAAAWALLLATLATGLLAGLRPVEAGIAVRRLAFPLREIPWPRTTDLRLISEAGSTLPYERALTVVSGESLELLVENTRGELPADAAIEYRVGPSGPSRFEPLQPIRPDIPATGEIGRAVVSADRSPVYLRATGGDHRTDWYRLDVVQPPSATDIAVTVVHPEYTGREPETLPAGKTSIDVLVGTEIRVLARTNKPVRGATVRVDETPQPTTLSPDGRSVSCVFVAQNEGVFSWWIDLTDRAGIRDPRPARYELRIVADTAPDVFIEQPAADLRVTAAATVALHVTATDDLALDTVQLEAVSPHWPQPLPVPASTDTDGDPKNRRLTANWNLNALELPPGTQLTLTATATDHFGPEGPHVSVSDPRTLTIVSPDAKAAELAEDQTRLLDELQRVLDAQNHARQNVADLQIQQHETGRLRRSDLDLLKRTELDQHRLSTRLFDEDDGIRSRLSQLRDQMDANGIEAPESRMQLGRVLDELTHIARDLSTQVETNLTDTRKQVEEAMNASTDGTAAIPEAIGQLAAIEDQQRNIADTIASLLKESDSWKRRVDLQTDLAAVASDQDTLTRESTALAEGTRQPQTDAERRQNAADAARLASRQQRLADDLDKLLADAESAAADIAASDPATAERLQDALETARTVRPATKMREAAAELTAGHAESAAGLQAEAADGVRQLTESLSGSATTPLDEARESLAESKQALQQLLEQQTSIADQLRDGDIGDELEAQQTVRQETERRQRQLRRSSATDASARAGTAAQAMREAEAAMRADDPDTAGQKATEAARALKQALEAARERQQQLDQQAASEQLRTSIAELNRILATQQELTQQTSELESDLQERGRRSRRQAREVIDLAARQGQLLQALAAAAEPLRDEPVLGLVADSIGQHMNRAAGLLQSRETGPATAAAQAAAMSRLRQLLDALGAGAETDTDAQDPPADQSPAAGQEPGTPPAPEEQQLVPLLGQLRLLRSLQEELNFETAELSRDTTTPDETREVRAIALAARQQQIANIAAAILDQINQKQAK